MMVEGEVLGRKIGIEISLLEGETRTSGGGSKRRREEEGRQNV